jgi:antitoxin StbD
LGKRKLEYQQISTILRPIMNPILSAYSASISELKKNPSKLIERAGVESVAILNHNKPTAYLIPAETFEWISNMIEDQELREIIEQREEEKAQAKEISLDEL